MEMNVCHYPAQNKDAVMQLHDTLPEHMRPSERRDKAYVRLRDRWYGGTTGYHMPNSCSRFCAVPLPHRFPTIKPITDVRPVTISSVIRLPHGPTRHVSLRKQDNQLLITAFGKIASRSKLSQLSCPSFTAAIHFLSCFFHYDCSG